MVQTICVFARQYLEAFSVFFIRSCLPRIFLECVVKVFRFSDQVNGRMSVSEVGKVKVGPVLVSGSRDKTIKFFDVTAGVCLFTLVSFICWAQVLQDYCNTVAERSSLCSFST